MVRRRTSPGQIPSASDEQQRNGLRGQIKSGQVRASQSKQGRYSQGYVQHNVHQSKAGTNLDRHVIDALRSFRLRSYGEQHGRRETNTSPDPVLNNAGQIGKLHGRIALYSIHVSAQPI